MREPLPHPTMETNQFDMLLDAFSRHLLLAEAVKIGTHDPLSCTECIHWCKQLAELDYRQPGRRFTLDPTELREIEFPVAEDLI